MSTDDDVMWLFIVICNSITSSRLTVTDLVMCIVAQGSTSADTWCQRGWSLACVISREIVDRTATLAVNRRQVNVGRLDGWSSSSERCLRPADSRSRDLAQKLLKLKNVRPRHLEQAKFQH